MSYDASAEANCAKALAKFAQSYGFDRFTWSGTIQTGDKPEEGFAVEVRLGFVDQPTLSEDAVATMPQAAVEIERLRAVNAELVEALNTIATGLYGERATNRLTAARGIARAAITAASHARKDA